MKAKDLLAALKLEHQQLDDRRYAVKVDVGSFKPLIKKILSEVKGRIYLSSLTAVDELEENKILLNYNFWVLGGFLLSIRVELSREKPEIDSLIDLIPGAFVHELEVHDLFGIKFRGNNKIWETAFKPEEFKGVYPLRKDWG